MFNAIRTIFLSGLCCCGLAVAGQMQVFKNRSQAIQQLKTNLADTSFQKICNYLGRSFLQELRQEISSVDSAFFYLRKSVYRIDSANRKNLSLTNDALVLLAETYMRSGKKHTGKMIFDQAIRNFHQAGERKKEADAWFTKTYLMDMYEDDSGVVDSSYETGRRIYQDIADTAGLIRILLGQTYYHFRCGRTGLAETELLDVISLSKRFRSFMLPIAYYQLSVIKRYAGHYDQGVRYALVAEKVMMETNDTAAAHDIYGELALEYQELDKPRESVLWYKKCLEQRIRLNTSHFILYRTAYLLTVQMLKTNDAAGALRLLLRMQKDLPPTSPPAIGFLAQSLAYCYSSLGQYGLAEKYFLQMNRQFSRQPMNGEIMFLANTDLAGFYINRKQFDKAGPYLAEAGLASGVAPISRIKDWHLMMFRVDSANGQFNSAIRHYQEYKTLSDSLFNEANRKQLQEMVINYEVEKKDNELRVFEKENKLQQVRLDQAGQERNRMIAGSILMLVIIALLIHNARVKQRLNKLLTTQKKEIGRQNDSLRHLLSEKDWLVKEIHHRVKNNFQMVMGLLGTQTGYLKGEEATMALSDSRHRVQAMSLIHQRLYQSDNLSAISMSGYIHELADSLRESFNLRKTIQFKLEVDNVNMDLAHSIPIGLIINEAITNSIKYAFPDDRDGVIEVSLGRCNVVPEGTWELRLADNGVGLPAGTDIDNPSTMGLKLIKGLSEDLDAGFSITNQNGTIITVRFAFFPDAVNITPAAITSNQPPVYG